MNRNLVQFFTFFAVLVMVFSMALPASALPAIANQGKSDLAGEFPNLVYNIPINNLMYAESEVCSSGLRSLSKFGDRVYPDQGNGGYTSLHTDLYIYYDATTNLFLPGTRADLTIQSTQCLTDFSFDFERTAISGSAAGPNMTVTSVLIEGQPATFDFRQPTYPGNPNGPDDPNPLAHAISNVNPVSASNPFPPACSPQVSGNSQNGLQCPANKLVITPSSPIPSGTTFTVTINYTGRPGVHTDGDGSTEGWFRVNTAAAPNDGGFVTTEPVGSMAWMPLNNHPSAKPTYDVYDTVPIGKTAIAPGELVGYTPSTIETTPSPTSVNPPDANFPGGSWTWHWHSPEPIANYLVTNTIGSYDLTVRTSTTSGIQYYIAMASGLTAARKATIKAVLDTQESITEFQVPFAGPYPFTTAGVIVALPSVGFAEEMQTKITFGNGASSTPSVGTFHHESFHQWFGDNVAEAAFNLTFWKEGWATIGEYLNTARNAANAAGGIGTPAGNLAFDNSLISRFNTNYGSTSSTAWTSAPSNPTVGNLFTTVSTYTRPGTTYLALRQILDSSASRPESDRWLGAIKQIQADFGGGSITKEQLQDVFHQWLPNQSAACHAKLDQFFNQWFDTAYPTPNNATNKPQITGPGLNGPDKFYDDNSSCTRADQMISFGALPNKFFDDLNFDVSATSNSGLPVNFSAAGQCTISGSTVDITGLGTCTVTASQAGDLVFKPAVSVQQTFEITKHPQAITFDALPDLTFGDPDFDVSATASSGLMVSFSVGATDQCSISGSTVHITGAGSCTVTASQAGDETFDPAPNVSQAFNIAKADQLIDFGTIGDLTFGDADFTINAMAIPSGLPVTLASSGDCSLSQATSPANIYINAAGSCSITASQAGNADYNPAQDVVRTFFIGKAGQTITFNTLADKIYGNPDFNVSATASSGLPVSFSAVGQCDLSGATVHINGAGSCTITASQVGGANYNPATDVSQTFVIAKADQLINFSSLPNKIFGDPDFAIAAAATSGLPVTFSASGQCTVSGLMVHITAGGSCTITAEQVGNTNYKAAPNVSRNFSIAGYTFIGFSPPVNNPPIINTGKAGKTYPMKWQLKDGNGAFLSSLSTVSSITYKATSCSAFTTNPAGSLDSDAPGKTDLKFTGDTYHYNWATPSKGCYTLFVNLLDGSSVYAFFDLSK